jgi:hypothetical protein
VLIYTVSFHLPSSAFTPISTCACVLNPSTTYLLENDFYTEPLIVLQRLLLSLRASNTWLSPMLHPDHSAATHDRSNIYYRRLSTQTENTFHISGRCNVFITPH